MMAAICSGRGRRARREARPPRHGRTSPRHEAGCHEAGREGRARAIAGRDAFSGPRKVRSFDTGARRAARVEGATAVSGAHRCASKTRAFGASWQPGRLIEGQQGSSSRITSANHRWPLSPGPPPPLGRPGSAAPRRRRCPRRRACGRPASGRLHPQPTLDKATHRPSDDLNVSIHQPLQEGVDFPPALRRGKCLFPG